MPSQRLHAWCAGSWAVEPYPPFFGDLPARALSLVDVRGLQSLGPLRDLEVDALPLLERAETCSIDGAIVNEHFLPVLLFFSSRRRHTRLQGDWSSDVCSSD